MHGMIKKLILSSFLKSVFTRKYVFICFCNHKTRLKRTTLVLVTEIVQKPYFANTNITILPKFMSKIF